MKRKKQKSVRFFLSNETYVWKKITMQSLLDFRGGAPEFIFISLALTDSIFIWFHIDAVVYDDVYAPISYLHRQWKQYLYALFILIHFNIVELRFAMWSICRLFSCLFHFYFYTFHFEFDERISIRFNSCETKVNVDK